MRYSAVWSISILSVLPLSGLVVSEEAVRTTVLSQRSLEQLASEANLIVRGRIAEVRTESPAGYGEMVTVAVLAVEEQWKGRRLKQVLVQHPGGSKDGLTQQVTGFPEFTVGEEVLLFLKSQKKGRYTTVGGKQGKLAVQREAETGKRLVEDLTGEKEDLQSFVRRLRKILRAEP